MLKPPKNGTRCVVKELHPDHAGLSGVVENVYPDGRADVELDPCSKFPIGGYLLIHHCWLEEECHDQAA